MSGKAMGMVWELEIPHSQQFVLLAMADHADQDGGKIFPSVAEIAWKTGYSDRQVRRIVKQLRESKVLELVKESYGKYGTNCYRIDWEKAPKKSPRSEGTDKMSGGDKMSYPPDKKTPPPDIQMSPDPSYDPSINTLFAEIAKSKDYALYIFNDKAKEFCTVPFKTIIDVPGGLHDWTSIINTQVDEKRFEGYKKVSTIPSKPDLKPESTPSSAPPPQPPSAPKQLKKPSIVQPVNDAIAKHIQGFDPKLANRMTGILAQLAAGVWRKKLDRTKLTEAEYKAVARSIPKFVTWFKETCKGCSLPTTRDAFENQYTKFVAVVSGLDTSEQDDLDLDYMRTL